jgi:thioesterase domain-containing protein
MMDKSQTASLSETVSQSQVKSNKTQVEFWGAVRTVIQLKRQTKIRGKQADPQFCSPLVALKPNGRRRPFFLISGGGGGDSELLVYAMLAPHLSPDQPFYGLKARGFNRGQKPHHQVEAMAADYIKAIRGIQPEGPYLLGGECVGGVVAFEMAQQLVGQGQKVALILLDSRAPIQGKYQNFGVKAEQLCSSRECLFRNILDDLRKIPSFHLGNLLPYLFHKTRRAMELLTNSSLRESRQRILIAQNVEKNYYAALSCYRPQAYPEKIVCIVSEGRYRQEPTQGWSELAAGGLEVHVVPGTHSSYIRESVEITGKTLRFCLDAARAEFVQR